MQVARSLQPAKRPATVNDENLEALSKKASVHQGKENAISIKSVLSVCLLENAQLSDLTFVRQVQAQKRDPLKDKKTNIQEVKPSAGAETKPVKTVRRFRQDFG
jgi:hypothetical protein